MSRLLYEAVGNSLQSMVGTLPPNSTVITLFAALRETAWMPVERGDAFTIVTRAVLEYILFIRFDQDLIEEVLEADLIDLHTGGLGILMELGLYEPLFRRIQATILDILVETRTEEA